MVGSKAMTLLAFTSTQTYVATAMTSTPNLKHKRFFIYTWNPLILESKPRSSTQLPLSSQ